MKNKFKITIAFLSVLMIISCIYYYQDDQVEELDKKYFPELTSVKAIVVFKSNKLNKDTLYYKFYNPKELIADNEYYEKIDIFYCSEYVDNPYYIKKSNVYLFQIYIVGYVYNKIGMGFGYGFGSGIGGVGIGVHNFSDPTSSYKQNGHIYPDVYTFEMDTVTAMENWDTTMNLFPDVRKVWYSLSRGIVRYDMKDGESYKLVE